MLDSDIQNEVKHAQSVNGWTSGIFYVFTEKNENICTDSSQTKCASNAFCGYHSYFSASVGNISYNVPYAAIPYSASFHCNSGASPNNNDADQAINVVAGELAGIATDPLLNAWHDDNGNEINDKCAWVFGPPINSLGANMNLKNATSNSTIDSYLVQGLWSDTLSGCIAPSGAGDTSQYYQLTNRNSGMVADVTGASQSPGAQVMQYLNRINLNQQWKLTIDGPFYQIVNRNSGLVLDVTNGSTSPAATVIQNTNSNAPSQQWTLRPDGAYDQIINVKSGLVLDVSGASTGLKAPIIQYTNRNNTNQQWSITVVTPVTYYEIWNAHGDSNVMDVAGASITAGANVIQYTNKNGTNQNWYIVADASYYQIVNRNSGMVLDVSGASKSTGAQIIQYANRHNLNQEWRLLPSASDCESGGACQIVNVNSGLILDVSGASLAAGAHIVQNTNNGTSSQQWYFVKVP